NGGRCTAVHTQANRHMGGDAEIPADAPCPNHDADRVRDVEARTDLRSGHDVHTVAQNAAMPEEIRQQVDTAPVRRVTEAVEDGGTQPNETPDHEQRLAQCQWLCRIAEAVPAPGLNVSLNQLPHTHATHPRPASKRATSYALLTALGSA